MHLVLKSLCIFVLQSGPDEKSLIFFSASRNMSGEYQFRVENSLGNYTAKCLLDVLCEFSQHY